MQSENLTVKYLNKSKILKLDPFMLYLQVTPLKATEPTPINCIILQVPEPVDVGTDDKGVYEYVIWLDFVYQRK